MWTQHNAVAAFEGDQNLVDGGGSRIRGGNNRSNDADRSCDLDNAPLRVLPEDAHSLQVFDRVVDELRSELVLENLVLILAESGFVYGHSRQRLGRTQTSLGHCPDDGINLFLRVGIELLMGRVGSFYALASLLDGLKVSVHKSVTSDK